MARVKSKYSLEQHEQLGLELQTMRDRLTKICVDLSHAYPLKIADCAEKAIISIDNLRSKMDDEVCGEQANNKDIKATKIYYRSNRKDYISDPNPIYPLREVLKK